MDVRRHAAGADGDRYAEQDEALLARVEEDADGEEGGQQGVVRGEAIVGVAWEQGRDVLHDEGPRGQSRSQGLQWEGLTQSQDTGRAAAYTSLTAARPASFAGGTTPRAEAPLEGRDEIPILTQALVGRAESLP